MDNKKKSQRKTILAVVLVLAVCIAGFLVTSHWAGSMKIESQDDLVQALGQATMSSQPPEILATDQLDDCQAILFDIGDGKNNLVLLVPDFLFHSRWCYLDAVQSEPGVQTYQTTLGASDDPETLFVVYGSGQAVTVTAGGESQTVTPDAAGNLLKIFRFSGDAQPVLP